MLSAELLRQAAGLLETAEQTKDEDTKTVLTSAAQALIDSFSRKDEPEEDE